MFQYFCLLLAGLLILNILPPAKLCGNMGKPFLSYRYIILSRNWFYLFQNCFQSCQQMRSLNLQCELMTCSLQVHTVVNQYNSPAAKGVDNLLQFPAVCFSHLNGCLEMRRAPFQGYTIYYDHIACDYICVEEFGDCQQLWGLQTLPNSKSASLNRFGQTVLWSPRQ